MQIPRAGVLSTKFGRWFGFERRVAKMLPYSCMVEPDIMSLVDGSLKIMLEVGGLEFESEDVATLTAHVDAYNALLQATGSQFGIYCNSLRRKHKLQLNGKLPDGFASDLNKALLRRMKDRNVLENRIILSIIYANPTGVINLASSIKLVLMGEYDHQQQINARDHGVIELRSMARTFAEQFANYNVRIIGGDLDEIPDQPEQLQILADILCHDNVPVALTEGQEIRNVLATREIYAGSSVVECHGMVQDDVKYCAVIALQKYRRSTYAGMLNSLLRLPCEMVITQTFAGTPKQDVKSDLERHMRQATQMGDVTLADMYNDALVALDQDEVIYGKSHFQVVAVADSYEDLERKVVPQINTALTQAGFVPIRERRMGLESAYFSQMPGNWKFIPRPVPLSSANFAAMSGMHRYAQGNIDGCEWGPPLMVIPTVGDTPYYFTPHGKGASAGGNVAVIGKHGSGKTVLVSAMLSQSRKYGGKRIVIDKGRGWEPYFHANDGVYSIIERGVSTGMAPLQLPDTPGNRLFLSALLRKMVAQRLGGGREMLTDAMDQISRAVNHLFDDFEPSERRMSTLRQLLGEKSELSMALKIWEEEYGWVFDNPSNTLSFDGDLIGIDIGVALDDDFLRAPIVMYLLHMIDTYGITGREPCIIVFEEGWKAVQDEELGARADELVRTIRKRKGEIWFITQDPNTVLLSDHGWTIFNQSDNKIFFRDDETDEATFVQRFGLTKAQYKLLRSIKVGERLFFLRPSTGSPVLLRFDMSDLPEYLAVLSGTDERREEVAGLRSLHGKEAAKWLPHYQARYAA